MTNTKQNLARKEKWAKQQPGNLHGCYSPPKMQHNIKKEAAAVPELSLGEKFMHYMHQRLDSRKKQQAIDWSSQEK